MRGTYSEGSVNCGLDRGNEVVRGEDCMRLNGDVNWGKRSSVGVERDVCELEDGFCSVEPVIEGRVRKDMSFRYENQKHAEFIENALYGVCRVPKSWLFLRRFLMGPEISRPDPSDEPASISKLLLGTGRLGCELCNWLFWIMSDMSPETVYRFES
jgi:hypothetical protein